jgi:hypothetical protein
MTHPLVIQLRFTRSEFMRGIKGLSDEDARIRHLPLNCISWNVGHLAWQEQEYFLFYAGRPRIRPDVAKRFAYGAPASTPPLAEVVDAWKAITSSADEWLDSLTSEMLEAHAISRGKQLARIHGNSLQRVIYHYWYHTGENSAIRQYLGHTNLPQFVGALDSRASYQSDAKST